MIDRRALLFAGGSVSASMLAVENLRVPFDSSQPAGPIRPRNDEIAKAFRLLIHATTKSNPFEIARHFAELPDRNIDDWLYRDEWPKRTNPLIVGFFSVTRQLPTEGNQTAWCAAFVNFCLFAAGYEGTGDALSGSFRRLGDQTNTPRQGDVAVFRNIGPSGDIGHGHVGFYVGTDGRSDILVLGGNQRGENPGSTVGVKIAKFPVASPTFELHSFRSIQSLKKLV
jgi:uncharacterized protein (TIGR02594 family)